MKLKKNYNDILGTDYPTKISICEKRNFMTAERSSLKTFYHRVVGRRRFAPCNRVKMSGNKKPSAQVGKEIPHIRIIQA